MHARDELFLSVHEDQGRPSERALSFGARRSGSTVRERSRSLGPCGRGSSAIVIEPNEHSDLFQEIFHMYYAFKSSAHLSEM